MTRIKARFPGDINQPIRFFGRFTWRDIVRLTAPITTAAIVTGGLPTDPVGAAAWITAGGIGIAATIYRPHGNAVDHHLLKALPDLVDDAAADVDTSVGDKSITAGKKSAALIHVEPTNLSLKSSEEQRVLHSIYQDLIERVSYPIKIHSIPDTTEVDAVEGTLSITNHYISVRAADPTELNRRCREIVDGTDTPDLQAERITGSQLQDVFERFDTGSQFSDKLYLSEFPAELDMGWLADILQMEGMIEVTQTIEPRKASDVTSTLGRKKERISAEIDSFLNAGYLGTNNLEARLDDVNWFLDLLADRTEKPFDYGVLITIRGGTDESIAETRQRVETRLRTFGISCQELWLRDQAAGRTRSPATGNHLQEQILAPGSSVAAGFPFANPTPVDDNGVLFGRTTETQIPIVLDRFSWEAPHIVRIGMSVSGKSYHTKLTLLRTNDTYDTPDLHIIDPKQEYGRIARELQASHYTVDRSADTIDELIEIVRRVYDKTTNHDGRSIVVIDESHRLLATETGRQTLSTLIREARDTQTGIDLISQNAADFTEYREGRAILDNTPTKVFFKHERVPRSAVDYFTLSDREKILLRKLRTGSRRPYSECVIRATNQVSAKVRVAATEEERNIINRQ